MQTQLLQAIVAGTPGITLNVSAADLRDIVAGIVQGERKRIADAIERHREKPTVPRLEAAKMIGVEKSTLDRWAKDGYLVPVKIGRKVFYRPSDIEELLNRKSEV